MDSKSGFPPSSPSDDLPPPSYADSLTSSNSTYNASSSTSQYYSQQIQSQLSTLSTQITSLQTQKSLLAHAQDEKILSLLTPQIHTYLSSFAKSGLGKGTLILIPAKGLDDEKAQPAEFEDKIKEGVVEFDRVVKIRDKEGDSEGEIWYWRDEDMALRLAGYLRPVEDLKNKPLPPRKEEVKATAVASSSRGFWGRKKCNVNCAERPPLVEDRKLEPVVLPTETEKEKVLMSVKAEEVVFRMENDFGIFETRRGWGIVLKLRMQQMR